MTDPTCQFSGDREQAIVSYLYGDAGDFDRAVRAAFEAHLVTCERCTSELAEFADVRVALGAWSPPRFREETSATLERAEYEVPVPRPARIVAGDSGLGANGRRAAVPRNWRGHRQFRYPVRRGWSPDSDRLVCDGDASGSASAGERPAPQSAGRNGETGDNAPWRAELTALEQRLRADLRQTPASSPADADPLEVRRVRNLVEESERRQQRELALRLGEAMREVNAQRQEDLVRIDRNIGAMQSNTGREMLRQRSEMLNYVTVRTASQRGQ